MEITLTDPLEWSSRGELPGCPGVYVISKDSAGGVIYIGLTAARSGLRGRIRNFHRSATSGVKGHAGGMTFNKAFRGDVGGLSVRVHAVEQFDYDWALVGAYVAYIERRLIWERESHRSVLSGGRYALQTEPQCRCVPIEGQIDRFPGKSLGLALQQLLNGLGGFVAGTFRSAWVALRKPASLIGVRFRDVFTWHEVSFDGAVLVI